MQLADKLVLRSYHLLDYDWTPLSQNPSWRQCTRRCPIRRSLNMLCIRRCRILGFLNLCPSVTGVQRFPDPGMTIQTDPSIVRDESGLCATIHWGSSLGSGICVHLHSRQIFRQLLLNQVKQGARGANWREIMMNILLIFFWILLLFFSLEAKKIVLHFSICACHPCAGAMLIFSVSFQFCRMTPEGDPCHGCAFLFIQQQDANIF